MWTPARDSAGVTAREAGAALCRVPVVDAPLLGICFLFLPDTPLHISFLVSVDEDYFLSCLAIRFLLLCIVFNDGYLCDSYSI